MTLAPHEDRNVIGLDGPEYELPLPGHTPGCAICGKVAYERHHIWRRSDVIGDRWWVYVPSENKVYGNCIRLCSQCHTHITDGSGKLEWKGDVLYWGTITSAAHVVAWQPPVYAADDYYSDFWKAGLARAFEPLDHELLVTQSKYEDRIDPLHGAVDHDPTVCYACKRRIPKKREQTEEKKIRKTWSVAVPVDRQEDGADVLDTLIEEARKEMFEAGLPYGDEDAAKYHVMAAALGLFVTHAQSIMGDS